MNKFLVNIWAYNHHAKFEVESEDNPQSLENAILDKLGENVIKWENLGNSYNDKVNRITYEEVIDDTRPIQTKKVLGAEVGTGASI
jgi:argininosuccinate lyase